jgi:hypothetical protein
VKSVPVQKSGDRDEIKVLRVLLHQLLAVVLLHVHAHALDAIHHPVLLRGPVQLVDLVLQVIDPQHVPLRLFVGHESRWCTEEHVQRHV